MKTLQNTQPGSTERAFSIFNNNSKKWCILLLAFHVMTSVYAQTEKGTNALILHSFSPTGIKIDGLPLTLFPQNTGLGISFSSHKTKVNGSMMDVREKVITYGISLNYQFFLFNDFSVGLTGGFYSGTTTYTETEKPAEKYATTMMMGGLELRYYINGGRHLKYWLKASPALGSITSTYDSKEVHVPKRLYQFSGGPGISYFASRSFAFDLGLTYNVFTIRNRGNYDENSRKEYIDSVGIDVGFSIFF